MSAVDPTVLEPEPLKDAGAAADRRSARREKLRLLVRNPSAIIGGAILIFWIICAVFGDVIAPYSPFATDFDGHLPPGGTHILGTDQLGRDVLSRVII
ncbi:MAG: ABC transporter permease, partial [Gemmatimonadota bacterium]